MSNDSGFERWPEPDFEESTVLVIMDTAEFPDLNVVGKRLEEMHALCQLSVFLMDLRHGTPRWEAVYSLSERNCTVRAMSMNSPLQLILETSIATSASVGMGHMLLRLVRDFNETRTHRSRMGLYRTAYTFLRERLEEDDLENASGLVDNLDDLLRKSASALVGIETAQPVRLDPNDGRPDYRRDDPPPAG